VFNYQSSSISINIFYSLINCATYSGKVAQNSLNVKHVFVLSYRYSDKKDILEMSLNIKKAVDWCSQQARL